jgi:hypothetical protein
MGTRTEFRARLEIVVFQPRSAAGLYPEVHIGSQTPGDPRGARTLTGRSEVVRICRSGGSGRVKYSRRSTMIQRMHGGICQNECRAEVSVCCYNDETNSARDQYSVLRRQWEAFVRLLFL